jgi:hypothetical protein
MGNRKQTCAHCCKQKQWPRCDSHVFYRGTSVGVALFDRDSQAVAFRAAYFSFQFVYLSASLKFLFVFSLHIIWKEKWRMWRPNRPNQVNAVLVRTQQKRLKPMQQPEENEWKKGQKSSECSISSRLCTFGGHSMDANFPREENNKQTQTPTLGTEWIVGRKTNDPQ